MGRLHHEACHEPICGFCGLPVDEENTLSYRATLTQPGSTIELTEPTFDKINRRVRVGPVTSHSGGRNQNSYPCIYLMHRFCLELYQEIWPSSAVPLRHVITAARPTCSIDAYRHYPLSELDGVALISKFGPPTSRRPFSDWMFNSKTFSSLIHAVKVLPLELREIVFSYCQVDLALAITSYNDHSIFTKLVREDITRKRIAACIEVSPLSEPDTIQEIFTEKAVKLSEKLKISFVSIAGQKYLQGIGQDSSSLDTMEITICKGRPQLLALRVDPLGILNVAFEADAKGHLKWARPNTRKHDVVLDIRKFAAIRVVSDMVKCRMISPDLSGHNIAQPRPILPYAPQGWAPLPAASVNLCHLEVSGYVKASHVRFHTLDRIYLSYDPAQVLNGIFTNPGNGRIEVRLNAGDKATVRLLRYWDGRPSLQIEDSDGKFLPVIPNPDGFEEIRIEQCYGIWFALDKGAFIFNVMY